MNKNLSKKTGANKTYLLIAAAVFAALSVILYFSPKCSDDYYFLSINFSSIKEALNAALYYGNGRLLGNLGAIYLLKHPVAFALIKAGVISAIAVLIPRIINADRQKSVEDYLFSITMILGVAPAIFAEVFKWYSGFQNYVPPLLILLILTKIWMSQKVDEKAVIPFAALAFLVLGFCAQLYIEHNTFLNVVVSLFALIYSIVKLKKKRIISFVWFIASSAGAAAMILIPKVFYDENNLVSKYRSVKTNSLGDLLSNAVRSSVQIFRYFSENALLLCVLCVLSFFILRKTKELWKNQKFYSFINVFNIFLFCCVIVNLIICSETVAAVFFPKYYTVSISDFVFVPLLLIFVVFGIAVFHIPDVKVKIISLVCVITAAVSVAPLLVAYPINDRAIFNGYIFFCIAIIAVFNYLTKDVSSGFNSALKKAAGGIVTVLLCCIFVILLNNHYVENIRKDYIEDRVAKGADTIEVFAIPSDYEQSRYSDSYKYIYYHEEAGDIKFVYVDVETWWEARVKEGWF